MKYCLRWIILFRLTKDRTGDPTGFRSGPYVLARLGQYTICPASSFQIDRFRTDIFFLYRIKLNENTWIFGKRDFWLVEFVSFTAIYVFRLRNRCENTENTIVFLVLSTQVIRVFAHGKNENFQREKSLIRSSILWIERNDRKLHYSKIYSFIFCIATLIFHLEIIDSR